MAKSRQERTTRYCKKTKFGWLISGPVPAMKHTRNKTCCNLTITEDYLSEQIQRFWTVEDVKAEEVRYTKEEMECEQYYINNFKRNDDGRYQVRLPFREDVKELGDSEQTAITRFNAIERKLRKDQQLRDEYIRFMREYEELGHMTEIDTKTSSGRRYYLPHHCVIKESSTTTKLRVVFDASAPTTSGLSLNDVLMIGPNIQFDLFATILRFRKHDIVLTADVEKMFRQVLIEPQDRNFQCIVWRENPAENLKHFQLNTVTYGTAPASFLAIRTLQQAAIDRETEFPQASKIIKEDFYMDDLVTGGRSVEEVQTRREQVVEILDAAGFHLRKWCTNNQDVLKDMPNFNKQNLEITDKQSSRTLGLNWSPTTDELTYSVQLEANEEVNTKRRILSCISKLFDPLGLISPIIVKAKILMQRLWQGDLRWDEPIPPDLNEEWNKFYSQLLDINEIKTSRQATIANAIKYELHGFSDASERAYGGHVCT